MSRRLRDKDLCVPSFLTMKPMNTPAKLKSKVTRKKGNDASVLLQLKVASIDKTHIFHTSTGPMKNCVTKPSNINILSADFFQIIPPFHNFNSFIIFKYSYISNPISFMNIIKKCGYFNNSLG